MSVYCTIEGTLIYLKQEDFDAAKKILEDGGWIKDGNFVDECNNVISDWSDDKNINQENRTIFIPLSLYRNMSRLLTGDKLLKGNTGKAVLTCTDGCFEGFLVEGETGKSFDLEKWAKENDLGDPPTIDEECEDGRDSYADWLYEVEMAFFEEYN